LPYATKPRKHYDGPKPQGLDWEAKQQTNEKLSFNMAMSQVATMLETQ
jgi:hypothetical protein